MTDPDSTRIALAALLLLSGGITLNMAVDRAAQLSLAHYSWAIVVIGVSLTVACSVLLIGWTAALWVIGCFVASGTPMVVGALVRHEKRLAVERADQKRKAAELEARLLELHGANETTTPG